MRTRVFALAAALVAVLITTSTAAEASHWRRHHHRGPFVVAHEGYYPRYYRVYNDDYYSVDPYAYRYTPRAYYPYYNSGYWVRPSELRWRRKHFVTLPRYYQAWGYPRPVYDYSWRRRHW